MDIIEAKLIGEINWDIDTQWRYEVNSASVNIEAIYQLNTIKGKFNFRYGTVHKEWQNWEIYADKIKIDCSNAEKEFRNAIDVKNKEIKDQQKIMKENEYIEAERRFAPIMAEIALMGFVCRFSCSKKEYINARSSFPVISAKYEDSKYKIEYNPHSNRYSISSERTYEMRRTSKENNIINILNDMWIKNDTIKHNMIVAGRKASSECAAFCLDTGISFENNNLTVRYTHNSSYSGFHYQVEPGYTIIKDAGEDYCISLSRYIKDEEKFKKFVSTINSTVREL